MSRTANLDMPLVQPSQAQKHVTVNEALGVIDGIAQLTMQSLTISTPPVGARDGEVYAVPAGATGDWVDQTGQLAIFSNGGWVFAEPKAGWRGWVADSGVTVLHDGTAWQVAAVSVSGNGAGSLMRVVEIDVAVSGRSVSTDPVIPSGAVVFGVSGRVLSEITGSLSAWRVGVADGSGRYATGLGLAEGSWVLGASGQPQAYYGETPLLIEGEGGDFAGGTVRIALHLFEMSIPRA